MNYFEKLILRLKDTEAIEEKIQIIKNSLSAIDCFNERMQEIAQLEIDNYIVLNNINNLKK